MDAGFANECAALAKLYDETNGDNRLKSTSGSWFYDNELASWRVQ